MHTVQLDGGNRLGSYAINVRLGKDCKLRAGLLGRVKKYIYTYIYVRLSGWTGRVERIFQRALYFHEEQAKKKNHRKRKRTKS